MGIQSQHSYEIWDYDPRIHGIYNRNPLKRITRKQ